MENIKPFRFWCQKILPLTYDNSISYYELLCKVVTYLNECIERINEIPNLINNYQELYNEMLKLYNELNSAYEELVKKTDEYFNNLNLQNEVNNKLDEMLSNGELNEILINFIDEIVSQEVTNRMPNLKLVDTLYYQPYAKVIPDTNNIKDENWSAQGFCIAIKNNVAYGVHCFENSGGYNTIKIYNLLSGGLIIEKTGNWGHTNDICYNPNNNHLYVTTYASATPINTVVELDFDTLNVVNTYTFALPAVYGIAFANNLFYLRRNPNTVEVYNDLNSAPINSYSLYHDNVSIYQSIATDGTFLFIPHGNAVSATSNVNNFDLALQQIDCYKMNGEYVKTILLPCGNEVESIDFYNNECYIQLNTLYTACIIVGNIYYNQKSKMRSADVNTLNPKLVNYRLGIYVDQTNTQYLMDGTQEKPLLFFNWCWLMMGYNNKSRLDVFLLSDITNAFTLVISTIFNQIVINANNHRVPYLYVSGGLRVNLNNAILYDTYSNSDACVYVENNSYVSLQNCILQNEDENNIPQYGVYGTIGAQIILNGVQILSNYPTPIYAGFNVIYSITGALTLPDSKNVTLSRYQLSINGVSTKLLYNVNQSGDLQHQAIVRCPNNFNFDIALVKLPCKLQLNIESNNVIGNSPVLDSGYVISNISFDYIGYNNIKVTVYTLSTNGETVGKSYTTHIIDDVIKPWVEVL